LQVSCLEKCTCLFVSGKNNYPFSWIFFAFLVFSCGDEIDKKEIY